MDSKCFDAVEVGELHSKADEADAMLNLCAEHAADIESNCVIIKSFDIDALVLVYVQREFETQFLVQLKHSKSNGSSCTLEPSIEN